MSAKSLAKARLQRTVVHSFEVINECQNVSVTHRYSLKHGNFISDLALVSLIVLHRLVPS